MYYHSDHDREEQIPVNGFDLPGQFKVYFNYSVGWEKAVRIVDLSEHCGQFMRWDCLGAIIHNPISGDLYTYWKNRAERKMNYFGGATADSGNCACGQANTCSDPTLTCNCDYNDDQWRFDEGDVSNKDDLPVHSFHAGDTG